MKISFFLEWSSCTRQNCRNSCLIVDEEVAVGFDKIFLVYFAINFQYWKDKKPHCFTFFSCDIFSKSLSLFFNIDERLMTCWFFFHQIVNENFCRKKNLYPAQSQFYWQVHSKYNFSTRACNFDRKTAHVKRINYKFLLLHTWMWLRMTRGPQNLHNR
jgi:hypothetical protein